MKITRLTLISIASALLFNFGQAQATTTTLAPTQNMTYINYDCGCSPDEWNPDAGLWKEAGGTEAGSTNWMIATIFVRFQLPTYVRGTDVTNADFVLKALTVPDNDYPLSIYKTGNDIDPWEIHTYTQPNPRSGTEILSFSPTAGELTHLNLTFIVNSAYHNDGVITFLVTNISGFYNYQEFEANKKLDLTISAVPEPETYGMILAGLGLIGMAARRTKRST